VTVRDLSGRHREILRGKWDSPESKTEYSRVLAEMAANQGGAVRLPQDRLGRDDLSVNALILA
jgi:hypothetical protein